jgi:hypothetical protein
MALVRQARCRHACRMSTRRMLAGFALLVAGAYEFVLHPRLVRWGATDEEVARTYPGRELVPEGKRAATMAITIEAPPANVWPWLLQMGWDRAGWYSWDRLDNGGSPSARELHPEWQDRSVGDYLSAWSPSGSVDAWEVAALEPGRFLGLRGLSDLRGRILNPTQPRPPTYTEGLWGFLLEELPGDRTRLIVSGYQTLRPRWLERFFNFWIYPVMHWPMQVRQLANIKRNVESAGGQTANMQITAGLSES